MALICKPEKRTKCHDKAKKHYLRRKIIDDKIKGSCGKPFVTKKVRAVEKVGCPRQEDQAEANKDRADSKPKARARLLILQDCHLTSALSGRQHTPCSGFLLLLVRDE
jgi:hypothetical protein